MAAVASSVDPNWYFSFGFKTLERSYLLRINGRVAERPQHMIMRVAVGIHGEDLDRVIETYNLMSERYFTHASPTLFNAGTPHPQLSSCFLVCMKDDSIEGIYDTLKSCAMISKTAGGIGLNIHCIRATGYGQSGLILYMFIESRSDLILLVPMVTRTVSSPCYGLTTLLLVTSTRVETNDLVPLPSTLNHGMQMSSISWIFARTTAKRKFVLVISFTLSGSQTSCECKVFHCDRLFRLLSSMKRVEANGDWSLFCPNEAPGLHEVWGPEFEALYEKYEREGRQRKTIPAQKLWYAVLEAQIETGGPFMVYKDHANCKSDLSITTIVFLRPVAKSNQKNLGTIKSSNLCTEIIEYSSPDETAVCNLASLALPTFINNGKYDFKKLHEVAKVVAFNLNRIIDVNYYPTPEARRSNARHRPIGIGVQGLADTFMALRMAFDSPEAKLLNIQIFETIYHGALEASSEMAAQDGTYETYEGSPASQGQLQYDLWGVTPTDLWDWASLKQQIARTGLKNSLLVAPMPTASTSQILGFNECFEPYTRYASFLLPVKEMN